MASTFSDLKIELIGTGEQVGTWGSTTNTNLGTAVEEAIVGSADVSFSSADVTVTLTNSNGTQAARHLRLNLTGTSGGARQLILGSGCQIDKPYIINNGLADAVTVKNTTGTGVVVPAGRSMWVFNNSVNVVEVVTHVNATVTGNVTGNVLGNVTGNVTGTAGNVTGTVVVANGGTGRTTLTANNVIIGNGTSTVNFVAPGALGNVLTSNGTTWTSTAASGGVTPAASSVDNGIVLFSGTGGATLKSSAAQDGFIHGLRIGLGASTNSNNAVFGRNAGNSLTTGANTVLIGGLAGEDNTTGGSNVFIGTEAGRRVTTGNSNVAIGTAAFSSGTSIGAEENVAIGLQAMLNGTTGNDNVVVGRSVLGASFDGSFNVVIGGDSGNAMTSNINNVLVGSNVAQALTTGSANTAIGTGAGSSNSPYNLTTEFNRVVIGNNQVTNAYIQVAFTVGSDGRDKEDVRDVPYGLSFVSHLRPVQYKWDKRSNYYETTKDGELIKHPKNGSKKENRIQLGFIAQDVISLEKEFGAVAPLIGDDEQEESLKVTETKFIPILVKAIQELTTRLEAAEAEIALLKG